MIDDDVVMSFDDLIEGQEEFLFSVINHNPQHLLHHLLKPPSVASQNYELDTELITDANFISRMIFKDTY